MTAIDPGAFRPPALRWLTEAIWRVEHGFERANAENPVDSVRIRMVLILAVFTAGFLYLSYGAAKAVILPRFQPSILAAPLPPGSRADLVDRRGDLLALDLPVFSLYLDPNLIWDKVETRRVLGPFIPAADRRRLEETLKGDRRLKIFGPFPAALRTQIDNMGLPGVSFEKEPGRSYPLGDTASHLIGYVRPDGVGMAGAEGALDQLIHDHAAAGPVSLALDLKVQGAVEDELKVTMARHQAAAAVGIVTNIRTGEILALASFPDTDPQHLASDPTTYANRAAGRVYEMGSTMKVFSFAMGIDSGKAHLNDMYDVGHPLMLRGQTINDSHDGVGRITLRQVFLDSSNIGTARMAIGIGGATMGPYYEAFGLTKPAPVELKETAAPLLPRDPERRRLAPANWTTNIVANTSFGHGIAVSPLNVAAGVGAIMNGGQYVPLTILKRDGPPPSLRQVVKPETSRVMLDLMRANAVEGTGRSAELAAPGFSLGGKTGTAEKPMNGSYARSTLVSSFVSVFPTDTPLGSDKYLLLVLIDEPHTSSEAPGRPTGGIVAAPTAGRIINRIAPFLGLQRRTSTPQPAVTESVALLNEGGQ